MSKVPGLDKSLLEHILGKMLETLQSEPAFDEQTLERLGSLCSRGEMSSATKVGHALAGQGEGGGPE